VVASAVTVDRPAATSPKGSARCGRRYAIQDAAIIATLGAPLDPRAVPSVRQALGGTHRVQSAQLATVPSDTCQSGGAVIVRSTVAAEGKRSAGTIREASFIAPRPDIALFAGIDDPVATRRCPTHKPARVGFAVAVRVPIVARLATVDHAIATTGGGAIRATCIGPCVAVRIATIAGLEAVDDSISARWHRAIGPTCIGLAVAVVVAVVARLTLVDDAVTTARASSSIGVSVHVGRTVHHHVRNTIRRDVVDDAPIIRAIGHRIASSIGRVIRGIRCCIPFGVRVRASVSGLVAVVRCVALTGVYRRRIAGTVDRIATIGPGETVEVDPERASEQRRAHPQNASHSHPSDHQNLTSRVAVRGPPRTAT
jgi:hypothetical protein